MLRFYTGDGVKLIMLESKHKKMFSITQMSNCDIHLHNPSTTIKCIGEHSDSHYVPNCQYQFFYTIENKNN